MHFQFVVAPPNPNIPPAPAPADTGPATADLLRELIAVQREQLEHMRQGREAADPGLARWQAFLARYREEFPDLGRECQTALPAIERAFLRLLDELSRQATDEGDALAEDFSLAEFLDRYGMRLSQLGTVLNVLGPIAEAARQAESG